MYKCILQEWTSFISFSSLFHFSFHVQISKSEACGGVMRLIVGGGRAVESSELRGAVVVGVRTLSEGGRVGNFSREQVTVCLCNPAIFFFVHISRKCFNCIKDSC